MEENLCTVQGGNSTDTDPRRREPRHEFSAEATVQVMEATDEELLGHSSESEIVEVSVHGLRLTCDAFLKGCILGIWIDLADGSDGYFLAAEVRWASWHEGEGYQVGVEMIDHPLAEKEKWNDLWASRLG